jgi:hypothetical protein
MSKMNAALSKSGITTKAEDKKSKSSMVEAQVSTATEKKVDKYLAALHQKQDAEAEMKVLGQELIDIASEQMVTSKNPANLVFNTKKGSLNVIYKDQFGDIQAEDKDQAAKELKAIGLDLEEYVTEKNTMTFDFDALTSVEQKKLLEFVSKTLGQERFEQVAKTKTSFVLKGIKDDIIKKAKSVEAFQTISSALKMYKATISEKK